jgi:hypothetical protein
MLGDREPVSLPSVPLISRSEMATLLCLIVAGRFSNTAQVFSLSVVVGAWWPMASVVVIVSSVAVSMSMSMVSRVASA